jgi:hypothetical protein
MLFRLSYVTLVLPAGFEPAWSGLEDRRLSVSSHGSVEVQAGVAPAHDGFADRRVPVSPLHRIWLPLMVLPHRLRVQSALSCC